MSKKREPTLLEKLEKSLQNKTFDKYSAEAYKWLEKEANKLRGRGLATQVREEQRKTGRRIAGDPRQINVGDMLFYVYSPKYKDDDNVLPFYDSNPLIFLLSVDTKTSSFFGINLHYVPPRYRAIIFDQLIQITNNKKFNSTTKLQLSYDVIKKAAGLKILRKCVKKYLFSHMLTKAVKIQPSAWEIAMYLPMAKWNKASATTVWAEVSKTLS